jgi:hypothetical protein
LAVIFWCVAEVYEVKSEVSSDVIRIMTRNTCDHYIMYAKTDPKDGECAYMLNNEETKRAFAQGQRHVRRSEN